ncbi:MAG TPA: putative phage abortive infection protein [Ferruginibacter sp.]|jgi:hypothetical protein|nr:putative phage abortive infection protein [Ferruginibacter sp.]
MKKLLTAFITIFALIGFISLFFVIFNPKYFNTSFSVDTELASKFGEFFGGYIGTLFSILSVLLLIYSIYNQNIEAKKTESRNHFFKMIDYHNENVRSLSIQHIDLDKDYKSDGRRAFVVFKIQIHELLRLVEEINKKNNYKFNQTEIIDITYIVFFFGIDSGWILFIKEKLKKYPYHEALIEELLIKIEQNAHLKLGRTNQTSLSTYFRNMYNAIKLIDDNKFLSIDEKKDLIKIYRAQLSNPELYVLFFNVVSRFGKKWKEKKYITRYEFIKNIPTGYCDGYDPKIFFPITYEEEEL